MQALYQLDSENSTQVLRFCPKVLSTTVGRFLKYPGQNLSQASCWNSIEFSELLL